MVKRPKNRLASSTVLFYCFNKAASICMATQEQKRACFYSAVMRSREELLGRECLHLGWLFGPTCKNNSREKKHGV